MAAWVVWLILAVLLGVAEVFTLTAVLGLLGAAAALRPQLERFGVDALVGRRAYALTEVTVHQGTVRIGGEEWTARSYHEDIVIPAETPVNVMQIDGATAVVYPQE